MGRGRVLAATQWLRQRPGLQYLLLLLLGAAALSTYARVMAYMAWKRDLGEVGFVGDLQAPGRGARVLVIAPHPDDETLGCGGLMRQAVLAGAEVYVALMTNGDASELALIFGQKHLPISKRAFINLGKARQKETLAAVAKLGVPPERVFFLGYPNNGLSALWQPEHWSSDRLYTSPTTGVDHSPYPLSFTAHTPYCGEQLVRDLQALLRLVRPTHLFVTHPLDNHPDHWATAAFLRSALRSLEAGPGWWAAETRVYGYLIHWPRWPVPRLYAPRLALLPPPDLLVRTDDNWLRLPLSDEDLLLKTAAIRQYRSQLPGHDRLLLSFSRPNELFAPLTTAEMRPNESFDWRGRTVAQHELHQGGTSH